MFLAVITAGIVTFYFSSKNRILRELKKSRKKSLNSIKKNEYAKVIGISKPIKAPLTAPLSDRICVYYHVTIEVKRDKNWRKIIDHTESQDFFIVTNTEMAMVKTSDLNPSFKHIHLVNDFNKTTGFRNDAPEKLEAYLKAHNKKSTSVFGFNKQMRYREGVIELDEPIAVKGMAEWQKLNTPMEGYSYSKIITLTGTKKQKLLVTDEPKALKPIKNI